jgi:hypothetical protein
MGKPDERNVNNQLNDPAVFAILPPRNIPMKLTIVRLALALMFITGAGALDGADATSPDTNSPPYPMGGCNYLRMKWYWTCDINGLNLAPGKTRVSSLPL